MSASRPNTGSIVFDRMWQGASGLAPWQRAQGQVDNPKNVRFSRVEDAAVKRGPSELVSDLTVDSAISDFYFANIRGVIIAIGEDEVYAWDENGVALTVTDETSGAFFTYVAGSDLPSSFDILTDIVTATSFDTLIVANRLREPTLTAANTYQASINYIMGGAGSSRRH